MGVRGCLVGRGCGCVVAGAVVGRLGAINLNDRVFWDSVGFKAGGNVFCF
jgi:hypothetical protein